MFSSILLSSIQNHYSYALYIHLPKYCFVCLLILIGRVDGCMYEVGWEDLIRLIEVSKLFLV